VQTELSCFRHLTAIRVGNGESTSFWHDRWLLNSPLTEVFPAPYSHCTAALVPSPPSYARAQGFFLHN
jgi:hypothetical protein